jgi:hypothetical protein
LTKNPETRGSRNGETGRPPAARINDDRAWPFGEPSEVVVAGRSPSINWNRERRNDFNKLAALAAKFDLLVQELAPVDGARRPWTRKRVDLEYAERTIWDRPGIRFDDWAAELYPAVPANPETTRAARSRAKVALSKLFLDGRIEKRYDAEGFLLLYRAGTAPKEGKP